MRRSALGTGVSNSRDDLDDISQKDRTDPRQSLVPIRQKEQDELRSFMLPGHVIQVCGPPLSGKSTLVQQAIDNISEQQNIVRHDFMCERISSLSELFHLIATSLNEQPRTVSSLDEEHIFSIITSSLMNVPHAHHVFVFHTCHNLRQKAQKTNGTDGPCLGFLRRMADHLSQKLQLTILLTTRKRFQMKGHNTHTVEIGMLDYRDITRILQHVSGNTDPSPYVSLCLNMLPLPGAVRLFGVRYLVDTAHSLPPDSLGEMLADDDQFWSEVFESQLDSVKTWLPGSVLSSVVHFCQFFGRSFLEGHLECTFAGNNKQKWQKLIRYLRRNYIVWSLPGTDRLVVHPLLVYYLNKSHRQNQLVLRGQCYDKSCNRYTDFLCRLLHRVETNMAKDGQKGLVYGCLALEWPNIRHMIDMAIKCNENTYKLFLKAAISARGVILRCFSEEAHDVYAALFECAKKYGTVSEQGMVEALLGHSKACTAILSKGGTWQQSEACLDSAIEKLRKHGPSFGLMVAIYKKAIILTRQGKYAESQRCFKAAKRVSVVEADDRDLNEAFGVSRLQIKEEKITRDIYAANALIFLGENSLAQEVLQDCYENMQNEFSDHPELATAVNSLGLIEERGNHDLARALDNYIESYRIRQKYASFNKEILVVSLNNIGMILLRQGQLAQCKKYLTEALKIRRDLGWVHSHTALSLTHMGAVNFQCGDFAAAYKNTQEADKILQKINCIHDTRLRINNSLGHLSKLLEMERRQGQDHAGIEVERSAKGHFDHSVEIANKTTGNHSDDGYHHLFLAHEHAMLLALGNSMEDYERHKRTILPYFEVDEAVGKKVFNANERVPKHNDLHIYYSSTDYETVDKRIFISHLVKACEFCQRAGPFYSAEEIWCRDEQEHTNCEEDREVKASHEDELLCSLANSTSEQEDTLPDNLDNTDSDSSHGACREQDEKLMPSDANLSLVCLMSKSREDLEKYKSLYLSTVSVGEEESQLCTPSGNLSLQQNDKVTATENLTNNSDVYSKRQDLILVNLQGTTSDDSQINKNSNTECIPPNYEQTLKDYPSNNQSTYPSSNQSTYPSSNQSTYPSNNQSTYPSSNQSTYPSSNQSTALLNDSSLDNSPDVRLPVTFSESDYSNAVRRDENYQCHTTTGNSFGLNILHENSSPQNLWVNNNDIIEYGDDDDYTDDDYDKEYDDEITSENWDVNESHWHERQFSDRNGQGHIDSSPLQVFPPKENQIRREQSSHLSALHGSEMSRNMKDVANQNFQHGTPGISQLQHSPADGEFHVQLDNKQFEVTDNASFQRNDLPNQTRNQ